MSAHYSVPWGVSEVQTFLCILGDEEIQRELDGAVRNENVFKLVARRMADHGFHRTSKQCRSKSKKLRVDYRRIKDHNSRSGVKKKSWKWFDMMDAIYGHRPTSITIREDGIDSATALPKSMVEADDSPSTSRNSAGDRSEDSTTSYSSHGCMAMPNSPAPTLTSAPAALSTATTSSTSVRTWRVELVTGKTKEDQEDHVTVLLREMQASGEKPQEWSHKHCDKQLKIIMTESQEERRQEANLRREDAQQAAFNQSILATMSQLVQVLSGLPNLSSSSSISTHQDYFVGSATTAMEKWTDSEVRELLSIRGEEEIKKQFTGKVQDTVVYGNISRLLAERGIHRSQTQVINKLKDLKKEYNKVHDHNKSKSGTGGRDWKFYDLCNVIFGNSKHATPVRLSASVERTPIEESTLPLSSSFTKSEEQEDISNKEDEFEDSSNMEAADKTRLAPSSRSNGNRITAQEMKRTNMEKATSARSTMYVDRPRVEKNSAMLAQEESRLQRFTEHDLQTTLLNQLIAMQERISQDNRDSQMAVLDRLLSGVSGSTPYSVPPRKMKRTKMEKATSARSTVYVDQLREMNSAMQAQEDAHLQKLTEHEQDLQSTLLTQLIAMQERISRANRDSQMAVLDRLISGVPGNTLQQTPQPHTHVFRATSDSPVIGVAWLQPNRLPNNDRQNSHVSCVKNGGNNSLIGHPRPPSCQVAEPKIKCEPTGLQIPKPDPDQRSDRTYVTPTYTDLQPVKQEGPDQLEQQSSKSCSRDQTRDAQGLKSLGDTSKMKPIINIRFGGSNCTVTRKWKDP